MSAWSRQHRILSRKLTGCRLPSLTIENYAKAIYQICHSSGRAASTGSVAQTLSVSPGTVTAMLKTLSETGLAQYKPYEGVELTDAGSTLALRVIRRHRLIELFLVETLGLTWDEVHDEAEHMEHAVSDFLVERMDQFLGSPAADPHGDPIPSSDGRIAETIGCCLAECGVGERFRFVRVLDQSPEFLRFLSDSGLALGVEGSVASHLPEAGVITLAIEGAETTLARHAAERILVLRPAD